jgi:hypothetical protein
LYSF